jgi:hypothetical protein
MQPDVTASRLLLFYRREQMAVSDESFFASKTMVLLVITMGFIFALVIIGIVVKVVWGEDVFNMISSGIGGLVGQSAQGTYRNVKTDTPMRLQESVALPIQPISSPPTPSTSAMAPPPPPTGGNP